MLTEETLVVSEIFGPTWQGEGPSLGRRCGFVRLGRCNLACTWCDTPYTWDWTRFDPAVELQRRPVDEIVTALDAMDVDMVVITGGEPLLQQRHLQPLMGALTSPGRGWWVEVETAGTIAPGPELTGVERFNVSPKLANSGNEPGHRYRPDALRSLQATGRAQFKFVVTEADELAEVQDIVDECGLSPVWIMPEGTDAETLVARARALADPVAARGWNLTTRLHVLLWGDRRGV